MVVFIGILFYKTPVSFSPGKVFLLKNEVLLFSNRLYRVFKIPENPPSPRCINNNNRVVLEQ